MDQYVRTEQDLIFKNIEEYNPLKDLNFFQEKEFDIFCNETNTRKDSELIVFKTNNCFMMCNCCSNSRMTQPEKFKGLESQTCMDCLEKFEDSMKNMFNCVSCMNNRMVQPEKFIEENQTCLECQENEMYCGKLKMMGFSVLNSPYEKEDTRYMVMDSPEVEENQTGWKICFYDDIQSIVHLQNAVSSPENDDKSFNEMMESSNIKQFKNDRHFNLRNGKIYKESLERANEIDKNEKCFNCNNNRKDDPNKFRKNSKICEECIEKRNSITEAKVDKGKCFLCSNNRTDNPNKFRNDNKTCNDCIEKRSKYAEKRSKNGKCFSCSNNKKDHPSKFRGNNKTCDDCLDKQKERVKNGKCTNCKNNRNQDPSKFSNKSKTCDDCLEKHRGRVKNGKCLYCKHNRTQNAEKFRNDNKTCNDCIEKRSKYAETRSKNGKCFSCSNNKKDHPTKFRNNNKTCNDCLDRRSKYAKDRTGNGVCFSCNNNKIEHAEKFKNDNKTCVDCLEKQREKYKKRKRSTDNSNSDMILFDFQNEESTEINDSSKKSKFIQTYL